MAVTTLYNVNKPPGKKWQRKMSTIFLVIAHGRLSEREATHSVHCSVNYSYSFTRSKLKLCVLDIHHHQVPPCQQAHNAECSKNFLQIIIVVTCFLISDSFVPRLI